MLEVWIERERAQWYIAHVQVEPVGQDREVAGLVSQQLNRMVGAQHTGKHGGLALPAAQRVQPAIVDPNTHRRPCYASALYLNRSPSRAIVTFPEMPVAPAPCWIWAR